MKVVQNLVFDAMTAYIARDTRPVMIIEDNADDQAIVLHAIEQSGVPNPILVARDGQTALTLLQEASGSRHRMPCLIILDLNLPDTDGLALIKELKTMRETRPIPVIVLTGSESENLTMESYNYGASSYIVKGADFRQLSDKIVCMAQYWLKICRLPAS